MFTRKQYMDGEVTHEKYYGQFVTPYIRKYVEDFRAVPKVGGVPIGVMECKDEYFNDIELKYWVRLSAFLPPPVIRAVAESNASTTAGRVPNISESDKVCVIKAAARQIRGW